MSLPENLAILVSAEHASSALPPEVGDLGLVPDLLSSHLAWDPGAAELAGMLARRLDAELMLGTWSRLLVDLNRSPDNPDVIPVRAFGTPVPGNAGLDAVARAARIATYHAPYQARALEFVAASVAAGRSVLHLSVHSFTPTLAGKIRDVEVGLLLDPARGREARLGVALLDAIARKDLDVRANEPYDGRADALVTQLRRRFPEPDYLGLEIEINQRLVRALPKHGPVVVEAIASVVRPR